MKNFSLQRQVTNMKSFHVLAICVVTALVLGSSSFTEAAETLRFDYTDGPFGPVHWGDYPIWQKCKTGMMQSPMEIVPEIMHNNDDLDSKLHTSHPKHPVPATISNNGHTVELTVVGLKLKIDKVHYKSTQMHFHYPSEHRILGYRFPLELHMVHVEPVTNKTAVISWLFTMGEDSPFLAQFFDELPKYVPGLKEPEKIHINPIKMLSTKGPYGRYMGSLTTPPCTEHVTWSVKLYDHPTVSYKQMEQLKKVLEPNARPTQQALGRKFYIST